jgi:hypothetical protein
MATEVEPRNRLVTLARVAVFAALAYGVNAPFLIIPNIETFSLALFLSGVFLGIASGMAVAIIAGIIFVFFNPNGPQTIIPAGLAQLAGFLMFGLFGGVLRRFILDNYKISRAAVILVIAGAVLTIWYDLSTNVVFALLFGPFWQSLIAGMGFGIIHFISNVLIFGLSSLIIGKIWKRIEYLMPPLAG